MYVKYALMKLAVEEGIDFVKINPDHFDRNILPKEKQDLLRPSQSFFVVRKGEKTCRVIVDCSESYLYMSPVIQDSDLYFCSSYKECMFKDHVFFQPYPWQKEYDLQSYKNHFEGIEEKFGESFHKIMPFIPLPMVMDVQARLYDRLNQLKLISLTLAQKAKKRLPELTVSSTDPELLLLNMRYNQLKAYRENRLQYDIVLRDALWGWPHHRLKLHQALRELPNRKIFASLSVPDINNPDAKWRHFIPEQEVDSAISILSEKIDFPKPYEEMLTSSRLAVFATGKHWGSRMIAFISMLCGGPIMMDRPMYESYFPMSEFDLYYLEDDWSEIVGVLNQIDLDKWIDIRTFNQGVFDRYLAPVPVARYIAQTVQKWFAG